MGAGVDQVWWALLCGSQPTLWLSLQCEGSASVWHKECGEAVLLSLYVPSACTDAGRFPAAITPL